ncbi:MAG TPA: LuxR C-terminal-related transcriptional regulator [Thermoleophilaceae bacterium]
MEARRPRALVAGDEPLLARGIALLLDQARDLDALYVDSPARARRVLRRDRTELLVWAGDDLNAEVLGGLRELREEYRSLGLCLLARRADAVALERLVAHSGERIAFVLHNGRLDAAELGELVRSVLRGHSTLEPALLDRLTASASPADELNLTVNEREIMELVAAGLRNREIGRRLWKSEKAVEKHVGRLFSKLGLPPEASGHLDRRVAATRVYLSRRRLRDHGLVGPEDSYELPSPEPCGST